MLAHVLRVRRAVPEGRPIFALRLPSRVLATPAGETAAADWVGVCWRARRCANVARTGAVGQHVIRVIVALARHARFRPILARFVQVDAFPRDAELRQQFMNPCVVVHLRQIDSAQLVAMAIEEDQVRIVVVDPMNRQVLEVLLRFALGEKASDLRELVELSSGA